MAKIPEASPLQPDRRMLNKRNTFLDTSKNKVDEVELTVINRIMHTWIQK